MELSNIERKSLQEFLQKEFTAHNVMFGQLNALEHYGWQGERVTFERGPSQFELWLSNTKVWTVWVKPAGLWYTYSPSISEFSVLFSSKEKFKKLCSILHISERRYIEM